MNSNEKVVVGILGATGYLGGVIFQELDKLGFEVVDLGRTIAKASIDSNPPSMIFDAAFPTGGIDRKVENEYLRSLASNFELTSSSQITYYYLGSYSANKKSKSKYGNLKSKAEREVILKGGQILRVGLVIDYQNPKGRFLQFLRLTSKLPFIPVFPDKWLPIITTTLDEFRSAIKSLVIDQKVQMVQNLGVKNDINKLFNEYAGAKTRVRVPEILLYVAMYLSRFVYLGPLDSLKSVFYKEEEN